MGGGMALSSMSALSSSTRTWRCTSGHMDETTPSSMFSTHLGMSASSVIRSLSLSSTTSRTLLVAGTATVWTAPLARVIPCSFAPS